jgi:orotate phosphoribosyltransferase
VHLLPTQEEVIQLLRDTGALREGHFEYPSGLHSNEYLQIPLSCATISMPERSAWD